MNNNKTIFTTMKANRFLTAALMAAVALCAATTVSAKSWRINHNPQMKPHFTDINAAMASDEVQAGDTLYFDPNTNLSSTQDVTKQVTIVGTGWGGGEVSYARAVVSGTLNIRAAETKIVGLYLTGTIYIQANYVTMERCRVTSQIYTNGSNCKYATFRNCYFEGTGSGIQGQGRTRNESAYWTIQNCIFNKWNYDGAGIIDLYSATIMNNLIVCNSYNGSGGQPLVRLGNALVSDNIIVQVAAGRNTVEDCDGTFQNNIISQDFKSANNYIVDNNLASVLTGNYESYTLVEGSPAIGGGTDGQDVGIFGGLYPYVANNGLPKGYPYYTKAIVGAKAVDGKVSVTLNVKIANE